MPDDEAADSRENETSCEAQWRQTDLEQAIAAAEQAGLRGYRVEIAPDGTIAIVVGTASEAAADTDLGAQPLP